MLSFDNLVDMILVVFRMVDHMLMKSLMPLFVVSFCDLPPLSCKCCLVMVEVVVFSVRMDLVDMFVDHMVDRMEMVVVVDVVGDMVMVLMDLVVVVFVHMVYHKHYVVIVVVCMVVVVVDMVMVSLGLLID